MRLLKSFFILTALILNLSLSGQIVQPMRYDHYSITQQLNVGVGTARVTAPSAYLEVGPTTGANKGFLAPRLTTSQQNAISSPASGLLLYNTDSSAYVFYNGSAWRKIFSDTAGFFVTRIYRKPGTDSVFYQKGSSGTFAFKDSIGSGSFDTTTIYNTMWKRTGNAGTVAGTEFIGTTDAQDFVIKTGAGIDEIMRFSGDGYLKITMGYNNTSSGSQGIAIGSNNTASAQQSIVIGNGSTASGLQSVAIGSQNTASGTASTTIGSENIASGNYSFATGQKDTASGLHSAVFGAESKASGNYSFAQGHESVASGVVSTAIGNGVVSTGYGATTFGKGFTNAKDTSFAVGFTSRKLEVSPDSVIISPAVATKITGKTVITGGNVGIGTTSPATLFSVADLVNIYDDGGLGIIEVLDGANHALGISGASISYSKNSSPSGIHTLTFKEQTTGSKIVYMPDTAGTLALKDHTFDSLRRVGVNVQGRKNGTWITQYTDSVGSGGSVSSASGSGVSLVNGSSAIKRLKAGTGINITDNTDSVTIDAAVMTVASKSGDQTTSSASLVDCTDLSFSADANATYEWEGVIVFTADASTTGIALNMNGPSVSFTATTFNIAVGGSGQTIGNSTAFSPTAYYNSTSSNGTAISMVTFKGIARTSASGTVQFKFMPEAGSGGSITVKQYSFIKYRKIS